MDKTEHLLVCLMEECAEVQHAAAKALRFGLEDSYKGAATPMDVLKTECADLLAVMELCVAAGLIKDFCDATALSKKKARVKQYMGYARGRGKLQD